MTDSHDPKKGATGPDASALRKKSRRAAFWYLFITITGPLVVFYFPSKFFVAGDAAATMANILARPGFFRLGILVDFASAIGFLMTALALYELLKKAGGFPARVMVALVLVNVSLVLASELFKTAPLLLATGAGPLKALPPLQVQPLAMFSLEMLKQGDLFAQLFWGLWLLPLGLLVIRSGWFPKFLGFLQLIAGLGYVAGFVQALLFPGPRGWLGPVVSVMLFGELPFIFWLAIRGARPKPPQQAMPAGGA